MLSRPAVLIRKYRKLIVFAVYARPELLIAYVHVGDYTHLRIRYQTHFYTNAAQMAMGEALKEVVNTDFMTVVFVVYQQGDLAGFHASNDMRITCFITVSG